MSAAWQSFGYVGQAELHVLFSLLVLGLLMEVWLLCSFVMQGGRWAKLRSFSRFSHRRMRLSHTVVELRDGWRDSARG